MLLIRCLLLSLCVAAVRADTVAVPYTVKQEGQVSLAVYDQQGRLVRTLLTGAPRRPGHYAEAWDGTDRYGKPQPAGKYTWKLLETKGLTAEFLLEVGQNPIPKDARGIGNHGAPGSVVADETGVYFVGLTEGAHTLGKTDRDGKYLYARDPWPGNWGAHRGVSMALLDGKLYELGGDGLMYGYDTATGRSFTDDDFAPKPWNVNWSGTTNKVTGAMDFAADPANKLLVVSYREHNALRWFDPAQKVVVTDELTGLKQPTGIAVTDELLGLDQPTGVAVKADGAVLVIAKGAVWSLTCADKALKPVIPAEKLQSPWRLDVNRQTGEILVAENSDASDGVLPSSAGGVTKRSKAVASPRHHQVKKFSATGELLATYGQPAGRRDGPYIATDFRNINDVSFDPLGGFLVCEGPWTPPRRTVRLDDTGKVLYEWFGGQAYGTLCAPEPGDPTHVWFYCNAPPAGGLVRCQIDFAKKTWRVVETYWDAFLDNELGNITPTFVEIVSRDGRLYVYTGTPLSLSVAVYDPQKKTLRPSNHSQTHRSLPRELVPADFRGDWDSYIWNDLNDDGRASKDELVWMHRPPVGGYTDPLDFTLYLVGQASAFYAGHKITPRRFTAGGTPVYDWADAQPYSDRWKEDDVTVCIGDLHHNPDGTWFGCFATTIPTPHHGWESHGQWYFNSCSGMDRLVKWDKNWQPLWSVGRHSPDREHEVGSTAMARFLSGTTHGCVVWTDASDEETIGPTVWTDDGLYVDELWRIHGETSGEDVYGIHTGNEYATGRLHTDPKTGRVYCYMIACSLGSTVYEIHGWDGWRREQGAVELKRPKPAALSSNSVAAVYDRRPARGLPNESGGHRPPLQQETTDAEVSQQPVHGTGLKAEYFNNLNLTATSALTRVDGPVFHLWCTNAAAPQVHADNFSVRWSGQVQPPTTEPYKFSVETNQPWVCDGPAKFIRLWVNGRQLIDTVKKLDDQWTFLKAGQKYDIRIEGAWAEGNAVAKLCWETKTNDRRVILPRFLYPDARNAGGSDGSAGAALSSTGPAGATRSLWFRSPSHGNILPGRFWPLTGPLALKDGNLTAQAADQRLVARGDYADGQWHHVVQVSGGPDGDQRLYVDSALRDVGSATNVVVFGKLAAAGRAEVRDAQNFDRALHRLEIDDLYRRQAGLLAHVSFDDGGGIHPVCHGAVPGIAVNVVGETEWTKNGRIGGALTTRPKGPIFPSYIMIGEQLELPATDYTIAFWFKSTDTTGNLFCAKRRSPYNAMWTDHSLILDGGKLGFGLSGQDAIATSAALNDDQWHHVVTTVGGATKDSRLYVDGKLVGAGKLAVRQFSSNRLGVNLGGPAHGQVGATATFDDFRCYGRALPEVEIKALATP